MYKSRSPVATCTARSCGIDPMEIDSHAYPAPHSQAQVHQNSWCAVLWLIESPRTCRRLKVHLVRSKFEHAIGTMLSTRAAYKIAFAFVLWRACLAVIVRTSFDPDEYWQGPEVAHRLVFGCALCRLTMPTASTHRLHMLHQYIRCRYGHLTWEWAAGLRSYAHPLLFTPGLIFLQLLRLDTPAAVQLAPRVTQILFSLAHDAVLLDFARTHLPVHLQLPTLLVSSLSWFNCFTHTRPFSNCVESTLHLAALTAWPRINYPASNSKSGNACTQSTHRRMKRAIAILLAGLCCVIRPPACVLFLPIAVFEVLHIPALPSDKQPGVLARAGHAAAYICDCLALAAFILVANGLLDRHFYGQWVFPAWVNLEFNVLQNSSADYGTHPAHWYFSQGLPAMLGSLLPLTMWGVWAAVQRKSSTGRMPLWPLLLGLWGVAMHSVLPHKEFRYILPSFELILMYSAVPLISSPPSDSSIEGDEVASADQKQPLAPAYVKTPAQSSGIRQRLATKADATGNVSAGKGKDAGQHSATENRWRKGVAVAAIGLQLPMLLYFGLVHQRGTVAVMEHLSKAHVPSVRSLTVLQQYICSACPCGCHTTITGSCCCVFLLCLENAVHVY